MGVGGKAPLIPVLFKGGYHPKWKEKRKERDEKNEDSINKQKRKEGRGKKRGGRKEVKAGYYQE